MRFSNSTKLKMTKCYEFYHTKTCHMGGHKQSKLVREDYLKIEESKMNGVYSGLVPVLC